jgi:hypothetical protein
MYARPATTDDAAISSGSSSSSSSSSSGGSTIDCGTPPTVDPATGAVTNYTNVAMPDGKTCGENVSALSALCLRSRCTDASKCTMPNSTWDTYVAGGHACTKVTNPTCEQQACDAPYCTSASMVALVPLQHKLTGSANACVNPSEVSVASLCNTLPDGEHVYVFPDCRTASTQKVILTRTFTRTTRLVEGQLSFPPLDKWDQLQFTYKLSALNGSTTGLVSVRPDTGCTVSSDICMRFTINVPSTTVLLPGTYSLTVYATAPWSPLPLLQSVNPESVQLALPAATPGVNPALNPMPTTSAAANTMALNNWFSTQLKVLANKPAYMDLNITVPKTSCMSGCEVNVKDMLQVTPDPASAPLLLFAATPNIIPLEANKIMPYQFLVMTWPTPANVASVCAAAPNDPLYYDVVRARTNGTGSTEAVLTHSLYPEVLDIVRVGDAWNYTMTAYQGSSYSTSTCKSEPVVVSVHVPAFDDQLCHQVVPPSTVSGNPLPPWMWATPQGCQWDTSNLGAQDYYCAFEYNKDLSELRFDATKLNLYEQAGSTRCGALQPSYATLTRSWAAPFATCEEGNTSCTSAACFSGYAEPAPRVAVCNAELQVGTSATAVTNASAFAERMANLMNYYSVHNVHPELDSQIDAIKNTSAQVDLYNKHYYNCGPATQSDAWGVASSACAVGDAGACQQAVAQGRCDYNICAPWTYSSTSGPNTYYTQRRTSFIDPAVADTTCCPEQDYVYEYNGDAPPGVNRGSCVETA